MDEASAKSDFSFEVTMDIVAANAAKQMAEAIDRDILVDLLAELKRQEELFVTFFCLIGSSRAEVLGDMALDGMEWPSFEETLPVRRMLLARWSP